MPPKDQQRQWIQQTLGVRATSAAPRPSGGDQQKGGPTPTPAPTRDPLQAEREQREQQERQASRPSGDRMADTARDLLSHYASQHLGPLREQALNDLARAWRQSPGAVIAAGAVLGTAGVAYLVGTGSDLPSIPPIPLDFLARRAPVFRGAELNIQVTGPITGPDSFRVSITFREQPPAGAQTRPRPGRGRAFTPRMTLRQQGVTASGPEPGAELLIEGDVPIPSDASAADAAATIAAIEDGNVEVDVGGSPARRVRVVSVTDNYQPDPMGLRPPPAHRALNLRLRTAIPPMFHQGPDEVTQARVSVRINRVSSEGEPTIRVHYLPFPAQTRGR